MSVQALAWAMAQTTGSGTRKAVLFALANCHNHHTGKCCPSIDRLAQETEFSERTVRSALNDLCAEGYISRVQRRRKDGTRGVYDYTLNMDDLLILEAKLEYASGPPEGDAAGPPEGDAAQEPEVDLEPSEETYVSSAEGDSAQKTPLQLLWDACDEYVMKAPNVKSPRAAYAKLVREMLDAGWTPESVRLLAKAYKRNFPNCRLTVAALAKWGEELDRGKRTLTEGHAENGGHGDDGGVPSVSVLPPEENARRMRELAASLGGSVIVMDLNTGEIVEGALDGADGYLEGLSAPSSALPSADPTGAPGEPVHPSAGSPHQS